MEFTHIRSYPVARLPLLTTPVDPWTLVYFFVDNTFMSDKACQAGSMTFPPVEDMASICFCNGINLLL
ncbi:hypothetical protein N7519_004717 [Penicillium mononematosum]|uniref:uncharacterized protein n=1 Tax=Penicillium mononematosum TaxID=268346 RepID=UPI0025476E00|nr:uncharacterized protein N7519_004717 [Penicillium mononematosum]KAJ6189809.1 hypothetical protein N7519_004717 [Penicillium mononematosum]